MPECCSFGSPLRVPAPAWTDTSSASWYIGTARRPWLSVTPLIWEITAASSPSGANLSAISIMVPSCAPPGSPLPGSSAMAVTARPMLSAAATINVIYPFPFILTSYIIPIILNQVNDAATIMPHFASRVRTPYVISSRTVNFPVL